jgi:hypothetical protein
MSAKNSETKDAPLAVRIGKKRREEGRGEKVAADSKDKVIKAREVKSPWPSTAVIDAHQNFSAKIQRNSQCHENLSFVSSSAVTTQRRHPLDFEEAKRGPLPVGREGGAIGVGDFRSSRAVMVSTCSTSTATKTTRTPSWLLYYCTRVMKQSPWRATFCHGKVNRENAARVPGCRARHWALQASSFKFECRDTRVSHAMVHGSAA